MSMAFDTAPFNEDSYMELMFIFLQKKYYIKSVVETGTYHGMTTSWLARHFDNVFTTEVNPSFYSVAQNRFVNDGVKDLIESYQSDSVSVLPTIIDKVKNVGGASLFFLDAHWYTNPLIGELEQIANSGYKPEIICIHDMMNPNDPSMGYDTYPDQGIVYTYEWVKPHIDKIYGEDGYHHFYNEKATGARRGALFIVNNNATAARINSNF